MWLGIVVIGLAVAGCGTGKSDSSSAEPTTTTTPSPTAAVQQVSDETICDLLFRDSGVMFKSVGLMGTRQTTSDTARQAREYAREADRIGSHARPGMAAKVEALSHSLRDFADWVDSPAGGFGGDDFAVAGLELGNTCGLDLPPSNNGPVMTSPTGRGPAQADTRHLTYFDVSVNSHLRGEGFWAANMTVCYVRPHPEANADGTTRVSTDPWSVLIQQPNGSHEQMAVSSVGQTASGLSPRYGEDLLQLGQCQTGWITLSPPGSGRFAGMKYAPSDFPDDTATWQW